MNNSPEARTPTGELKSSAAATPTTSASTETPTTETKSASPEASTTPPDTSVEAKPEAAEAPGEKSLLNEEDAGGAPEAYELKAPEGFELDKNTLEKATPLFKELNLSSEQAQKLVDFYAVQQKEISEAPLKAWQDTQKAWQDQVKAEYGNKFPQVRADIGRALNALGLPAEQMSAFRQAMDLTGAGNNPAFVKVFAAMSKYVTEGTPVKGGSPAPVKAPGAAPLSAAKAVYPNLPSTAS